MMWGGFGGFAMAPQVFEERYRCFPMAFARGKEDKEKGDKIILPASAFEKLAQMTISYPMQFELRNESENRRTHVGVLEFTAKEGQCFVPYWIMQNLLLPEKGIILVKNVTLKLATFVKFRPQTADFLDISNPKAVLESTLRNFSCMTKDDQICIPYNDKNYFLDVVDVKPDDACSIIEADVKVDFEPPVGYKEPEKPKENGANSLNDEMVGSVASSSGASGSFGGDARRLGNGEAEPGSSNHALAELARARELRKRELEESQASYVPFSGTGRRIDGKTKGTKGNERTVATGTSGAQLKKSKWRTKTTGTRFLGEARSLKD